MHISQPYVSYGNDGGIIQKEAQEGYAALIKSQFLAGNMTHEGLCDELHERFITQAQFNAIIADSRRQEGAANASS